MKVSPIPLLKGIFFVLALCAVLSCFSPESSSSYPSRAAAIVAHMHNPSSKYVVVAVHRGDWRNWPENSIPAIEAIDERAIKIIGDGNVLRTTNFSRVFSDQPGKSSKITDLTLEEIKRLSLKRSHGVEIDTLRMPTLREALLCTKDRICVNIDKGYDYYDEVLAITEELGVTDQVLIKGKKTIETVAAHEAKYQHNMMYMPVVDIQKPGGKKLFQSYFDQNVVPMAYEVCWQHNEDGAFEEACRKIVAQGSKIWVNTIWGSLCGGDGNDDDAAFQAKDPGQVYQQYLDNGVSLIQTDRPELIIGWLKSVGRHNLN